jgi:Topoisomerase C-terminal repeat
MLRGLRIAMHPEDGQPITLETGKYGPYIKHGTTYATLPKVGWVTIRAPCFHLVLSLTSALSAGCQPPINTAPPAAC